MEQVFLPKKPPKNSLHPSHLYDSGLTLYGMVKVIFLKHIARTWMREMMKICWISFQRCVRDAKAGKGHAV